jgi:predicted ATPase
VLCDQLGENPDLFGIVTGTGAFHLMRAELSRTEQSVDQMQAISERIGHPVMSIWTEWSYGTLHGHLGHGLVEALQRLDHGSSLYDPSLHPGFMIMTGFDAGLGCGFQGARVEWMLGRPDRAQARIAATVARARELNHPLMLTFALFFEAWIRQHGRDPRGVLAVTDESLALVEQYGYPHLGAWSRILRGWALAQSGSALEGEMMIREAIGLTDVIGIALVRPNFLALLADAQAMLGHVDEALATLTDARRVAERTGERCYLAEILRMTADLRMRKATAAPDDGDAIEGLLASAVLLAREQGARSFELRAATTRAVFAAKEGRGPAARAELAALVSACTEGLDTPDFRDAKSLTAV